MKPAPALGRPSNALLYSAILAMVLLWAANFIIGKYALREFPSVLLAGLRTSLAAVLILPVFAWWRLHRKPLPPSREPKPGVGAFVILGLAGVALNQLFFVVGLSRTSVAHSALIIGMTPVMVLLIAAARGMEKLTLVRLGGMGVALAGVAVLNSAPSDGAHATLAGDLIILGGALAFAIFTIAGKRATCCYDSVTVNTVAYVLGAAMLAPITIWASIGFDWPRVSMQGWLSLVYMAAFPSVVCYLIYYWALTYIPASRVSSFAYLQPPIATLMAAPLLGEPVTVWLALGGALILLGVFLTERGR